MSRAETINDHGGVGNAGLSKGKILLFRVVIVLLTVLFVEVGSQAIFLFRYKQFLWKERSEQANFRVRSMTELVPDERSVTMKRNFSDPNYEGWSIATDEYRFRRGTHTTDVNRANVVFIGDSVPFGWGVADKESLPSQLYSLLQKDSEREQVNRPGVINAAIPSYSLFQAVARYRHEISGKVKTDTLYLQIYSPVFQLVAFGSQWKPENNWTTEPEDLIRRNPFRSIATWRLTEIAARRLGLRRSQDRFSPNDLATVNRFRSAVRSELQRLHAMTVADGVRRLILAPVTATRGSLPLYGEPRSFAIMLLNEELRAFALGNKGVIYLDTIELLSKYAEREVFLDRCCHLTPRGNKIVAQEVFRLLAQP